LERLVIETEEDWSRFREVIRASLEAELSALERLPVKKKSRPPGYSNWCAMMSRCYNKNYDHYVHYGARGIKVYSKWHKFRNFIADLGEPPPGSSLERIDVNKGYSPKNCKWASTKEQSRNKRNTRLVTAAGKTQALASWAEETGIKHSTLHARLKYMTPEEAFSAPVNQGGDHRSANFRRERHGRRG
jgi:hypothetical protein